MNLDPVAIDRAVERVLELCAIPSPTGFADAAADYVFHALSTLGFSPLRSAKGAVVCELGGEGRPLVLAAHVDTLGAMVRSIKPNGRIRYTKVGGWPDLNVATETCVIHTRAGRTITGTFQPVEASSHVNQKLKDMKPDEENMEVVIDELVASKAETLALGVAPGDFISIDARPVLTPAGFIKSRHLDDKASSGVLLVLAELIAAGKTKLARKVSLVFTVWEEVGHGGAVVPEGTEEFVSVDMGCVGEDLACTDRQVSIAAKDSGGPYDRSVVRALTAAAERAGADFVIDVYPSYSSDADVALRAGHDLRHGCLGPGVYASHGYERTHRSALAGTLALLEEYVRA
jgi:putative aminopeptidase FrvX